MQDKWHAEAEDGASALPLDHALVSAAGAAWEIDADPSFGGDSAPAEGTTTSVAEDNLWAGGSTDAQELATSISAAEGGKADADVDADADGDTCADADDAPGEDVPPPPPKPARVMSAWSAYIAAAHDNQPSKEAGEGWRALDEAVKGPYAALSVADRERFDSENTALAAWQAAHPRPAAALRSAAINPPAVKYLEPAEAYFPLARVRKLIRVDPTVGNLSREGLFAIVKSAELMVSMLAEQSAGSARKAKRKSIGMADLGSVMYGARSADLMIFAHLDLPKVALVAPPATNNKRKVRENFEASDTVNCAKPGRAVRPSKVESTKVGSAVSSKSMTTFFTAKPLGESTPPPPTLDLARRVEKRLSRAHAEEAAKRDAKQVHEGKKHSMPPVFVDNAGDERSLSEWAFSEPKPATVEAEDETDDEASKGDGVIATKASRKRRMVLDDDEEDCEAW